MQIAPSANILCNLHKSWVTFSLSFIPHLQNMYHTGISHASLPSVTNLKYS